MSRNFTSTVALHATHHAAILHNYSHDLQVSHFTVELEMILSIYFQLLTEN